jgi:DNA-binding transcriptional MerR regulator
MATKYRIGEFSSLSGVSTKTLRFYDEIGLLRPASVDSRTGYRHYRPEQLEELASIVALKQLGVSLAEVRDLLSRPGSGRDRRALLLELKSTIEHSIETAGQTLKFINVALDELERAKRPIPVVVKHVPAVPVASVRAKVNNYEEILRFEEELLTSLPVQCIGELRGVLWHRCANSGGLEGEPFVALTHKVSARSFYEVKQLPASTVACAYSGLDDESAERSYRAIRKWMDVRGYQLAGPKREISRGSILEIQFPLKSA